jgi:DmsE family decaheme c-type cytochrome
VVALPLSVLATAVILLAVAPGGPTTAKPLLSQEPLQSPSDFVGAARCAICHQDISIEFRENPHAEVPLEIGDTTHTGCENCHGGGEQHAGSMNRDLIRRFNLGNALAESGRCLNCHSEEATHPDRFFDAHQSESVGCTSCHSIHNAEEAIGIPLLRTTPNELCADCHPSENARFLQPFSHRIDNGAVQCIDCHSPHGSPTDFQLVFTNENESACLDCHSDKRGPFAFEHMPSAIGGCTTCHVPHGSANPRMLVRHEVRLVCLECHTNSPAAFAATPPAFHDLRSPRFQNCTLCHTRIHGSHLSPALLR